MVAHLQVAATPALFVRSDGIAVVGLAGCTWDCCLARYTLPGSCCTLLAGCLVVPGSRLFGSVRRFGTTTRLPVQHQLPLYTTPHIDRLPLPYLCGCTAWVRIYYLTPDDAGSADLFTAWLCLYYLCTHHL